MKHCNQCKAANENGIRFCVNCGHQLAGDGGAHNENLQRGMGHNGGSSGVTTKARETVQQTADLAKMIWGKLLFPERIIAIGALLGCVASLFWGSSTFLLSAAYFLSMAGVIAITYHSHEANLVRRIELARWQIAAGAFWLSLSVAAMQIMGIVSDLVGMAGGLAGSFVSIGAIKFSLWLSLASSILVLSGSFMLQKSLLQGIINKRNN